ncbi:hypothetical protein D9615_002116 [Tricholomella constricta]|uniref:Major facilitator superfamily (MFS) profile domain-containing protein n=1 Tax=Tricholomella constricta TaxID=117010 RepID=A0A8H5HNY2_9AGAR|nr:hypothetical protein D9615_002116 [Tricholomella constricta]
MESSGPPPETTPLLAADSRLKHELVYNRFSRSRKWVILILVSWCGLIPLFVSGTFIPSIPEIAKDLDTTGPIISLAVSLSIFAASLGGLSGAAYSTFYGRRPVYLVGLPLLCIGSLGVGLSRNVPQLMIWRFLQAFGASPGMSVGAGVIGDIYRLEERGEAMGVFFAACLLGPALAPPIGGFAAQYSSWRVMQIVIGAVGCFLFLCMALFFPETCHPGTRGVDKIPEDSSKLVFVNPLKPLALLRSPNIAAVSFAGFALLLTDYVLLVPLAYTIGVRYNITSPALIGACFLPAGIGNMIGAPLSGRISDKIVVEWRNRRGGVWYPEDRLRATLFAALYLVPLSILAAGLLTQFVPGKIGLILNLVCLFINGVGVDMVLSPSAAYAVDIMHDRSAEAMAANVALRAVLLSISIAGILPLIEMIGVAGTNALAALVGWVGCFVLWVTIRQFSLDRLWLPLSEVEYTSLMQSLAAHYASWRAMQLALCMSGVTALLLMYCCFPETSHPNSRGIDKEKAKSLGSKTSHIKFINPIQALWLLRSPVVLGISLSTFTILLTDFAILAPMAYTIGKRYEIPNEALLGACFLPNGLGDIVGAPLAGRLSDVILARSRIRRAGVWCPEDRIKGTLLAASTLVPLSVLSFGLVNQFVDGTHGLILTLICLFVNGVGVGHIRLRSFNATTTLTWILDQVQMVLGPTAAYLIDIMPSRSAETVAASTGFRSWMLSIALSGALPLINSVGAARAYGLCAVLAWIGSA